MKCHTRKKISEIIKLNPYFIFLLTVRHASERFIGTGGAGQPHLDRSRFPDRSVFSMYK